LPGRRPGSPVTKATSQPTGPCSMKLPTWLTCRDDAIRPVVCDGPRTPHAHAGYGQRGLDSLCGQDSENLWRECAEWAIPSLARQASTASWLNRSPGTQTMWSPARHEGAEIERAGSTDLPSAIGAASANTAWSRSGAGDQHRRLCSDRPAWGVLQQVDDLLWLRPAPPLGVKASVINQSAPGLDRQHPPVAGSPHRGAWGVCCGLRTGFGLEVALE